jgi:hypothetical protein
VPISLRLYFAFRPRFRLAALIRFDPPTAEPGPRAHDAEHIRLTRELSKRLPAHLVRDILGDGE